MIVYADIAQGSEEWAKLRCGRPTASEFHRIISPKGESNPATWHAYAVELIAESIRPDEVQWSGNRHTERGNELEPEARAMLSERIGLPVEQVGFVTRDDGIVGCSPDGMVPRQNGGWLSGAEIKCPSAKVHVETVLEDAMPAKHRVQVHGSMAVCELDWWYFVSYCPGMKPLIKRIQRDKYTDQVSKALDKFLVFYKAKREEVMPRLLETATHGRAA